MRFNLVSNHFPIMRPIYQTATFFFLLLQLIPPNIVDILGNQKELDTSKLLLGFPDLRLS